ncbi:BldC family transcriptional regulator [Nocardiopsis sp. NPDC006198]|uniref:BldC family transcriptional regulator n=1 Tax=Nocardiopsis sp. NPDC006198 TaxID=3154472 RepID=UPI0033BA0A62
MSVAEELLTPGEVARMFRVDPKTVRKWGQLGRLTSVLTPGGHHRYRENEVLALLDRGRTTVNTPH